MNYGLVIFMQCQLQWGQTNLNWTCTLAILRRRIAALCPRPRWFLVLAHPWSNFDGFLNQNILSTMVVIIANLGWSTCVHNKCRTRKARIKCIISENISKLFNNLHVSLHKYLIWYLVYIRILNFDGAKSWSRTIFTKLWSSACMTSF